jgi:hypothetical protein
MDLGTTIIGSICISLCVLPFVLTGINRKNKERKLITSLNDLAKQHDCKITQHEICGDYVIGVDDSKNFVGFIYNIKDVAKQKFVDLTTVKNCEIININRTTPSKKKVIEKLNLNISFINKNTPNIILEFYNSNVNFQLSGEIESIEKWHKLINNSLNKKP